MTAATQITPAPAPAPVRNDPATFPDRADARVQWEDDELIPKMNQISQEVSNANAAAQASFQVASNANLAAGTSLTNYTPAVTGVAQNFTYVQTDRSPIVGMRLKIVDPANPAKNWAEGPVTAYNAATYVVSVLVDRIGSVPAAAASWTVFADGLPGQDATATFTSPTRSVAANGNITSADNGVMIKTTAAGVTLTSDTPAAMSGSTVYFLPSTNGVLVSGTFADGTTLKAVPRNCSGVLNSDGAGLYLDIIPPIAIPQVPQSADYTLQRVDIGCEIFHPSTDAVARTYTIPANAAVAFPIGAIVTFTNQTGAGAITIAINADTLRLAGVGSVGPRALAAGGMATAKKITATEWLISGPGLS